MPTSMMAYGRRTLRTTGLKHLLSAETDISNPLGCRQASGSQYREVAVDIAIALLVKPERTIHETVRVIKRGMRRAEHLDQLQLTHYVVGCLVNLLRLNAEAIPDRDELMRLARTHALWPEATDDEHNAAVWVFAFILLQSL